MMQLSSEYMSVRYGTCQVVLVEMFSTITRYGVRNGGRTLQITALG